MPSPKWKRLRGPQWDALPYEEKMYVIESIGKEDPEWQGLPDDERQYVISRLAGDPSDGIGGILHSGLAGLAGGYKSLVDTVRGFHEAPVRLARAAGAEGLAGALEYNPILMGTKAASEWLGEQEAEQAAQGGEGFLASAANVLGQTPGVASKFGLEMAGGPGKLKALGAAVKGLAQVGGMEFTSRLGRGEELPEAAMGAATEAGMVGAFGGIGKLASGIAKPGLRALAHMGGTFGLGGALEVPAVLSGERTPQEALGSAAGLALLGGIGEIKTARKLAKVRAKLQAPREQKGEGMDETTAYRVAELFRTGRTEEANAEIAAWREAHAPGGEAKVETPPVEPPAPVEPPLSEAPVKEPVPKLTPEQIREIAVPLVAAREGVEGTVVRAKTHDAANDVPSTWTRPGHFYRGMEEAEFLSTVGKGTGIQSRGDYSTSAEGTSLTHQAENAESYVNFGRSDPRKTGRPTYVVEVSGQDGLQQSRDGYFKAAQAIPQERITRIIEMRGQDGEVVAREIPLPKGAPNAQEARTPAQAASGQEGPQGGAGGQVRLRNAPQKRMEAVQGEEGEVGPVGSLPVQRSLDAIVEQRPAPPKPGESTEAHAATSPGGALLGAIFGSRELPDHVGGLTPPNAPLEARMRAAERLPVPRLRDRISAAVTDAWDAMRHTYKGIDPKRDVNATLTQDALRQHEAVPQTATLIAVDRLWDVKKALGGENMERVFSRLLVLRDALRNIERGVDKPNEDGTYNLAFSDRPMTRDEIKSQLTYFEGLANHPDNPSIRNAMDVMAQNRRAIIKELVRVGEAPPQWLEDIDGYWHRQVISAYQQKHGRPPGAKAGRVKSGVMGFQKPRTGSSKDYNTDFFEAEFEWTAQALAKIETRRTQAKLKAAADISDTLPQDARGHVKPEDIPEGYVSYDSGFMTMSPAERALSGVIPGADAVLTKGGVSKAKPWVIRRELAEVLDKWGERNPGGLDRAMQSAMTAWKQWILINPSRIIRYNANNMSGDIDITFALDPRIFRYAPEAAKELSRLQLTHKASRESQMEAERLTRLGVLSSGWSATEVTDIHNAGAFARLARGGNPITSGLRQYWGGAKEVTSTRENILRLAAYRHYLAQIKAGKRPFGASSATQMENMYSELGKRVTAEDIAAKLAREGIGDYGNISRAGKYLRSHVMPFYSWMEINLPRYARLLRNIGPEARAEGRAADGKVAIRTAGALAAKMAMKGGKLAVFATIFPAAVTLWNRTMFPDEDEKLNRDRRELTLILGHNDDGSIRHLRVEGALSDAMDWFGLGNIGQDIEAVSKGEKTLGMVAKDAAYAPAERVVNSWEPVSKTLFEMAGGRSMYPSFRRPSPIRDKGEHAAKALGLGRLYRRVTGKPVPPGVLANPMDALLFYRTDPGEAAWQVIREKVNQWQEKHGIEASSGGDPTSKQNALYYYKQAKKWKDERAADKWLKEYIRLGGSAKSLNASIARTAPLAPLPTKYRQAFLNSLSPEDRKLLAEAQAWFHKWVSNT